LLTGKWAWRGQPKNSSKINKVSLPFECEFERRLMRCHDHAAGNHRPAARHMPFDVKRVMEVSLAKIVLLLKMECWPHDSCDKG
jgi:hypothetical protein